MVDAAYTHVTIVADDLEESVQFYETVFGMERIPTPNWDLPIQWVDCGGLQLHIVETDVPVPEFHHFAVHVDDLEAVYSSVRSHETADFETLDGYVTGEVVDDAPPVYYVPTGTVQLYIRDPAGNMVEVNSPSVDDLDRSTFTNLVERDDVAPPAPGEPTGDIYGEWGFQPADEST